MNTLGDEYPKQQARVRAIQQFALEIGPSGRFLFLICEDLLKRADRASIEQDLPAMIMIYKEMQDIQ